MPIQYFHILSQREKERWQRKNELSVGDSNPGLSRDRRRYLTNYTNRDFWITFCQEGDKIDDNSNREEEKEETEEYKEDFPKIDSKENDFFYFFLLDIQRYIPINQEKRWREKERKRGTCIWRELNNFM